MIKNNKIQQVILFSVLCVLAALPAACGVKPRHVDPPASVIHDTFPQAYPPVGTDSSGGRYLPPGYTPQPTTDNTETQDRITP